MTEATETQVTVTQAPGGLELTTQQHKTLMDSSSTTDVRDILLPKILAMQGQSKLVQDEKAKQGEMRDSIEGRLMGDKNTPFEVIPFYFTKSWIIFNEVDGKMEYKGQVPYGPENANWEWEATIDGVKVRRDQSLNFYCIDPREVKDGMLLPYLISFRRTSYIGGRKLVTWREKLKMGKRALSSKTFLVSTMQQKNDKGAFYVFDVAMGRDTTQDEINAVLPWAELVRTSQVTVDDSDLVNEAASGHVSGGDEFKGSF